MINYTGLLARLEYLAATPKYIHSDAGAPITDAATAIRELILQLEAKRISHGETKLVLESTEYKLTQERKSHDATELRLEQTVANLNHERKAWEEALKQPLAQSESTILIWVNRALNAERAAQIRLDTALELQIQVDAAECCIADLEAVAKMRDEEIAAVHKKAENESMRLESRLAAIEQGTIEHIKALFRGLTYGPYEYSVETIEHAFSPNAAAAQVQDTAESQQANPESVRPEPASAAALTKEEHHA